MDNAEIKSTGYWVKLRHDRRMAGEGVTCRLLLASGYERKPDADSLWGECELYEGIIMDAVNEASRMLAAALGGDAVAPSCVCGSTRTDDGRVAWVERAYEELGGNYRGVAKRIADIAISDSGIVAYLRANPSNGGAS